VECGNGDGLDVSFRIQRGLHQTKSSLKPIPNTCDLTLFGLNADHRKSLAKSTTTIPGKTPPPVPCIISAGYQQRSTILFSGELRAGQDEGESPNVRTVLSSGDGDTAITQSRLTLAIAPGSSMGQVFQQILKAFGVVQPGNLQKALAQMAANPLAAQLFAKGAVLKGSAAEILSDICRSTGFQWSVQNGALSILPLAQPLDGLAVLIDQAHGMYGVPTVDTKGVVTVKTAMLPGLMPGSKVVINSRNTQGGFVVQGLEVEGDTSPGSTTWGMTLTAARY